jgi:DNA-binding protein H-NS
VSKYRELLEQKKALDAQIQAAYEGERAVVIDEIRQKIADYAIDLKDLAPGQRGRLKATGAVEPKYRDPKSGATWSGRGRAPRWMDGSPKDSFLIRA